MIYCQWPYIAFFMALAIRLCEILFMPSLKAQVCGILSPSIQIKKIFFFIRNILFGIVDEGSGVVGVAVYNE